MHIGALRPPHAMPMPHVRCPWSFHVPPPLCATVVTPPGDASVLDVRVAGCFSVDVGTTCDGDLRARARARLSVDLSRSRGGGGRLLGAPEPGAPLWLDASYHDKCKTDHNRRGCRDAQMRTVAPQRQHCPVQRRTRCSYPACMVRPIPREPCHRRPCWQPRAREVAIS